MERSSEVTFEWYPAEISVSVIQTRHRIHSQRRGNEMFGLLGRADWTPHRYRDTCINLREHREHWHPVSIWRRLIWTHQSSSTTFLPIQTASAANVNAVAKALLEKRKCAEQPNIPPLRDMPLPTGLTHRIALLHGYRVRCPLSAHQILSP